MKHDGRISGITAMNVVQYSRQVTKEGTSDAGPASGWALLAFSPQP
jgi:hypothetical protein